MTKSFGVKVGATRVIYNLDTSRGETLVEINPLDYNDARADRVPDVALSLGTAANGKSILSAYLSGEQLVGYSVKVEDITALSAQGTVDNCVRFVDISGTCTALNFNDQTLQFSIPQVLLRQKGLDIAPEALWNDGVQAFLMNYQVNTEQTGYRRAGNKITTSYIQLTAGVKLGESLRNFITFNQSSKQPGELQSIYTYHEQGCSA